VYCYQSHEEQHLHSHCVGVCKEWQKNKSVGHDSKEIRVRFTTVITYPFPLFVEMAGQTTKGDDLLHKYMSRNIL
jgi:hypothetical protein